MKYFLALLSGFVLTLTTFAGGAVTAIAFLKAEPVPVRSPYEDVSVVWNREPARVNAAERDVTGHPAQPPEDSSDSGSEDGTAAMNIVSVSDGENSIDATTTAAVPDEAAPQPEPTIDPGLLAAHVEWCSERYRSYRAETNTYTPYSGGKRECTSPMSDALSGSDWPNDAEGAFEVTNSGNGPSLDHAADNGRPGNYLSPEHVKSCMARYRSYRPEDNTYQPYGGGPRRQCR